MNSFVAFWVTSPLATTTSFYIGLESLAAAERFGEIVTAMLPPKMPHNARGWGNDLPISSTAGDGLARTADRRAWLDACKPSLPSSQRW